MSKRKIGIVVVLVLLIIGTIWAYRRACANAQMGRIKQMRAEMANMSPDQQREQRERLRKEMEKLTAEQRDRLREERMAEGQRRMDKRIAEYFALPPEKRNDYLDKQIQEMEKRRKEAEARRAQDGQSGQGQSGSGQNPNAPGQGTNTANAGQQRGGGRNASPDAQSARRNQRLDNTSPEQRASRAVYFSNLQQRRIAMGLPAFPGRGPGGR